MFGRTTRVLALVGWIAIVSGCNNKPYTVLDPLPVPPPPAAPTVAPAVQSLPVETEPIAPVAKALAAPVVTPPPPGWIPRVAEHRWRYIVIHHSATETGNAATFDRMHRQDRGWDELGYHFVITNGSGGSDGAVQIGPRWHKQKWGAHCGGTPNNEYNDFGIGICLVGQFDDHLPTERQRDALMTLIRFLSKRYAIGAENIISHTDAPNARTVCPGLKFHTFFRDTLARELTR